MARQAKQSPTDRSHYWQQRLAAQQQSGQSIATFCEQQGISRASFYQWRKKLLSPSAEPEAPNFIDLGLLRNPGERLEIRLDLGHGLILQVVRG